MVESNPAYKYNNSVDRIISKEKEREDIQEEILQGPHSNSNPRVSSVSTHNPGDSTCNPATTSLFPHLILHTELILQKLQRNYNYKAHPVQIVRRHTPATVPRASKHSTRQNPAPRLLQHKQASSNSSRQKQHSVWQAASTHSLQQFPGKLQGIHLVSTKFHKRFKYYITL